MEALTEWMNWAVSNQKLILGFVKLIVVPILVIVTGVVAGAYFKVKNRAERAETDAQNQRDTIDTMGYLVEFGGDETKPTKTKMKNSMAAFPPAIRKAIDEMVRRVDPKKEG